MTSTRNTLRRMAMALAVAYLVVLQALLGGLSSGAHAGSLASVDAVGQVLCLSMPTPGPSSPADPAHHTPDCCSTGCQTSVGKALPPTAGTALALLQIVTHAQPLWPRTAFVATPGERTPRHTRAPPLA